MTFALGPAPGRAGDLHGSQGQSSVVHFAGRSEAIKLKSKEIQRDPYDVIEFSAGAVIFEEGSEGLVMYVIVKGEVEISLRGKTLAVASAGEIVGEMALLKTPVRSATATAKTDCLLEPVDKERFELLVQDSPSFALYVMNVLADRIRLANDSLAP